MDTWATSSLTPQIVGGWRDDPDLFGRVFPMDLRPQAHEIIRTWLFSTVLRAHVEHGVLPWQHAVDLRLDPRPGPQEDVQVQGQRRHARWTLLERVRRRRGALLGGQRPARAWTPRFDAGQMKVGRRLATKLLNASRFVLGFAGAATPTPRGHRAAGPGAAGRAVARWSPRPRRRSRRTTTPRRWSAPRTFFWTFCDDYIELVKARAYGEGRRRSTRPGRALTRSRCRRCCGCSRRSCRT